ATSPGAAPPAGGGKTETASASGPVTARRAEVQAPGCPAPVLEARRGVGAELRSGAGPRLYVLPAAPPARGSLNTIADRPLRREPGALFPPSRPDQDETP